MENELLSNNRESKTNIPIINSINESNTDNNIFGDSLNELIDINKKLVKKIIELTEKYEVLVEKNTKAMNELKEEIKSKKEKINKIQESRKLRIKIPNSWVTD